MLDMSFEPNKYDSSAFTIKKTTDMCSYVPKHIRSPNISNRHFGEKNLKVPVSNVHWSNDKVKLNVLSQVKVIDKRLVGNNIYKFRPVCNINAHVTATDSDF